MKKKIGIIETLGAIFSIFFGSALHFTFEWSGFNKIVALISAVNESTWEHLKLGFWPLFFWGIGEYLLFGKNSKNFFFAKAMTLYSFCLLVPLIFYSYKTILGTNLLIFDISTFIISIIIAQFIGYKIIKSNNNYNFRNLSIILIILLTLSFLLFSYFPPNNLLFQDPISGGYGIIRQ